MQTGLGFLIPFAVLWLIAGTLSLPAQPVLKFLSILTILAVAVRLPFSSAHPATYTDPAFFAARLRPFLVVNAVQYLCIFAAIFWPVRHHRTDILAVLISIVVGLHFLLLAPLYDMPLYYATGAAILLADLLSLRASPQLRNPIASLCTGALLWSTALLLLHLHALPQA